MEKYSITINVWDRFGNRIKDSSGDRVGSLSFEQGARNKYNLELFMKGYYKTLKAWMPDKLIEIEASVFNNISGTWMLMHTLRPKKEELEFLNH